MHGRRGYPGEGSYIYHVGDDTGVKNKGYMLDLSIQDKFDGLGKVDELRSAIGENYLGNNELLNVSKNGNRCIVLRDNQKVSEPSWLTWNRMFS